MVSGFRFQSQKSANQSNNKQDVESVRRLSSVIMKSIRIIKPKPSEEANEDSGERKESEQPGTRKIVHTVKGWIAETQQRKRNQPRSLAALGVLIPLAFVVVLAQSPPPTKERTLTPEERAIKVTLTTNNGFLGQPVNRFKVGEEIPVNITMTNTSAQPIYTCISSDLYQDVPRLTHDGKVVPYLNWRSGEEMYAQRNHICQEENLPEPVLLKPNEPTVADWFVLVDDSTSDGPDAWYSTLPAGNYELSIQRRLACCDGPMVESNKVSFEVVQ